MDGRFWLLNSMRRRVSGIVPEERWQDFNKELREHWQAVEEEAA
jgi:hypothetical protein